MDVNLSFFIGGIALAVLEEIKGWYGVKRYGVALNIDLINTCPLKCPSCAVGSIGGRKPAIMDFGDFCYILDKIGKIRHVQFYMYSDPCLHPKLDKYVWECTKRGIPSYISTVLQRTNCDFRKLIEARPSEFRISFAGWDKMYYYQAGAEKEIFDRKVEEVCALPRYPETKWTMVFHLYNDNHNEVSKAKKLAEKHKLHFVIIPSIFMPCEKVVEQNYSDQDLRLIDCLLQTPEQSISKMKFHDDYCLLWKQISVDALGRVYLCQLVYEDRFIVGDIFRDSIKGLMQRIKKHPFCRKCTKVGGHVYQYCYADFLKYNDPVGHANKRRIKRA